MIPYLMDHAINNVWCAPQQDKQALIQLARLSGRDGVKKYMDVMFRRVYMPDNTHRFHVFQMGGWYPATLGIKHLPNQWVSLASLMHESTLIAAVYRENGTLFAFGSTFLQFTSNGNIIVALRQDVYGSGYNDAAIFFRAYSNIYYSSDRYVGPANPVQCESVKSTGLVSVVDFQRKLMEIQLLPGYTFIYVNGVLTNRITPVHVREGDLIEYVYDPSIAVTYDFKVGDLKSFTSTIDVMEKFLLHLKGIELDSIYFEDDIDIYTINKSGQWVAGVYYHRHLPSGLRMVTHRDYSISAQSVLELLSAHANMFPVVDDAFVRIHLRHSGFERNLVLESNRLFELYKLSDDDVEMALLGINATVPEWNAANLEHSPYTQIMGWRAPLLDGTLVQTMYGYNAMSRLFGDSPLTPTIVDGLKVVILPVALRGDVTVYEYDTQGKLLGWQYTTEPYRYLCEYQTTELVELIAGRGTDTLSIVYDSDELAINKRFNYRAYMCTRASDGPVFDWQDITNTPLYAIANNMLYWLLNKQRYYTALASDECFLADTYVLPPNNGVLRFTISVNENHGGDNLFYASSIPPRRLDVWLNKSPLIENIDFQVKWPQVVIFNTAFLNTDEDNVIDIRGVNFCDDQMQLETQREVGFVRHGFISQDHRFDIRDDKVLSFVLNGSLKTRDVIPVAEQEGDAGVRTDWNGLPYSVRETVVPLRGETYLDTYRLRELSMETDERVSDYMSEYYPKRVFENPNIIQNRLRVYSPFVSALVYALQNDNIVLEGMETNRYGTMDIKAALREYEYLLDFEPTKIPHMTEQLVDVLPHFYLTTVTLNVYHFNFLRRACEVYLSPRITNHLGRFITVINPTD